LAGNNLLYKDFSMSETILPEVSASAAPIAVPGLLDEIMAQTRFKPESESYDIARQGVTAFISALLQRDDEAEPVDILAVNAMIADIDARMGHQMDLILHAPEFQSWSRSCAH
jgi:type VI secretion system protein ImpC